MARILVVDDDAVTRLVLGSILEDGGHEIYYAANGELGLTVYQRSHFDLVIVDLEMPVIGGLRMIRELCEHDEDVRVIAISSRSPEHLLHAEDYGARCALVKPVDPRDLLQAVEAALKSRSTWDGIYAY